MLNEDRRQEFEKHPALASWIERMASAGTSLSLGEWMTFVGSLNQALLAAARTSRPTLSVEEVSRIIEQHMRLQEIGEDGVIVGAEIVGYQEAATAVLAKLGETGR